MCGSIKYLRPVCCQKICSHPFSSCYYIFICCFKVCQYFTKLIAKRYNDIILYTLDFKKFIKWNCWLFYYLQVDKKRSYKTRESQK